MESRRASYKLPVDLHADVIFRSYNFPGHALSAPVRDAAPRAPPRRRRERPGHPRRPAGAGAQPVRRQARCGDQGPARLSLAGDTDQLGVPRGGECRPARRLPRPAETPLQVCTSPDTILSQSTIKELIGEKCDGVIGQLTEKWDSELFGALKRAGGTAYSNYAVGYDNVVVPDATAAGIAVGNTPGAPPAPGAT